MANGDDDIGPQTAQNDPNYGGEPSDDPKPSNQTVPRAQPAEHTQQKYDESASQGDILERMNQLQGQIDRQNKEYNAVAVPMQKRLLEMLNQPLDRGLTMPQPQAQNTSDMQQIWKQNRHDLLKAQIGYAAVAIPLAIALGSRGGPAMMAAIGGLGKGMKSVTEGYDNQAEEAMQIWQRQGALGSKKFGEQMQVYKETLNNRGYNLDQMKDMISTTAKLYGDKRLADTKSWEEMRQELLLKERIKNDYEKKLHETTRDVYHKTGKSDVYKAWAAKMQDDYNIDVYQDWNHMSTKDQQTIRDHPFDKWLDEHKGKGKTKDESKKEEQKKPDDKKIDSWNKDLLGN